MLSSNSPEFEQAVRAALIGMTARAFAAAEFDDSPEITEVRISVHRSIDHQAQIDVELLGRGGMAMGGMAL